ncbi:hypothetical protein CK501_14515 [Halovibrio salipaludis]|uniref:dTDP-4-amino-4,6-dideoxygalactose transaminase n=1 Tax=Halovibrio salipaludis TaxID=2032626 RepID=A0A2A2EZD1_9GAMM|nr:hypothetical protein [Halovibrio salipaludis]PAU77900.1 hypothetical protein CK501_14515 [Halovibrio salipaludis]
MQGIGGYFELEVPRAKTLEPALTFQSARAAIASLCLQTGIKRVWLPTFLCNTVGDELQRVGIEVARYELQSDLTPELRLTVDTDEAALIVNYFGVCGAQVEQALKQLPPNRCIVDNSQAYGAPPSDCLGTVYSCRKFFGVPDGGLLMTTLQNVAEPVDFDEHSIPRCEHLLRRLDRDPEEGLSAYRKAEQSLAHAHHRSMSILTRRLLAGIDYQTAYARRRDNFRAVHRLLGGVNKLCFNDGAPTSPLTYPLMLDEGAADVRVALIDHRVFSPIYWPELLDTGRCQAATLAAKIVHIPIDQRYEPTQLVERLHAIPGVKALFSRGDQHASR